MRFAVWGIAALVLGALLAQALLQDRGYVLIDFRGYVVEMSVPGLVLAVAALYAVIRLLAAVVTVPKRVGSRLAGRRTRRAGGRLTQALLHMAEGDWARGERLLTRGLKGSQAPLAHYLLAARAAQRLGSTERRDEWLKIAYEEQPKAETPILLTRAELQLEGGEHARALATLRRIDRRNPNHPVALGLLVRTCAALGDREQLAGLLPRLGRRTRIAVEPLLPAALTALEERFKVPALTRAAFDAYWNSLPQALRAAPEAFALRARTLERLGHGEQAERELRAALKRTWQAPLVAAYGEVHGKDRSRQLRFAEDRLKEHPEDAALLATAARLCIESELWGKARSYLESSLAIEPDAARYALYGRLLDRLGEGERAGLAFRSGLALLEHGRAALPALAGPAA
ncbi:MAG TPA: heme biosynthesis HemY N-terminal domain-containing protein [Gammaproteobacteria bacterium]|nr:heme biosynthesis HemY N-terminal domain-containing protein [Gammaproteobacteria bacterium]